jgi:hypothetical protein
VKIESGRYSVLNRKVYKHNTYAIYISKMKVKHYKRNQEKNLDVQTRKIGVETNGNKRI